MHLHPQIHADIARDIQTRRIAEARAAATARPRAAATAEPAAARRAWIPALRGRFTATRA